MVVWLIDGLIYWLIDWFFGSLIVWLISHIQRNRVSVATWKSLWFPIMFHTIMEMLYTPWLDLAINWCNDPGVSTYCMSCLWLCFLWVWVWLPVWVCVCVFVCLCVPVCACVLHVCMCVHVCGIQNMSYYRDVRIPGKYHIVTILVWQRLSQPKLTPSLHRMTYM